MFILSKRNIILPSPDGCQMIRVTRDFVGEIPDWAAKTSYFNELVRDGKIVPSSAADKDLQEAAEKPVKARRGKAETEKETVECSKGITNR